MSLLHECEDEEIIAILDAGSQYGKVIDRKVRELNVATVLLPLETSAEYLKNNSSIKGIIISGGPSSVNDENAPCYDSALFSVGLPILGICYGMQMANVAFGGTVEVKDHREDGQHTISVDTECTIFNGLSAEQEVLLTHGDSIGRVADGFTVVAQSGTVVSGIADEARRVYGVQFHPEVELTRNGRVMLKNFLFKSVGAGGLFTMRDREQVAIDEIRQYVGDKKVLVLVSGGVDSTVCAALVSKAIGPERIVALHIDNGLMRKDESKVVMESLAQLGVPLRVVDASTTFYDATTLVPMNDIDPETGKNRCRETRQLKNAVAPEDKRRIIGDTFMVVAERAVQDLNLRTEDVFLAQGTLRPDLIESASSMASGKADAIKTHHNDTQLVRKLRDEGRVIEPLKDYHKDEVRELGKNLGLPDDLVMRQPFPGPGLGVRLLCVEEAFIDDQFDATQDMLTAIVGFEKLSVNDIRRERVVAALPHGVCESTLYNINISATLLPVKTVGVQGDGRTYSYLVGLSSDEAPHWPQLFQLAKLIPKVCKNVNRIVYVFGSRISNRIMDVTETHCSPDSLETLRIADDDVNRILREYHLTVTISQVPVILVPLHFDRHDGEPSTLHSIAIRTFITSDFMTGVPAMPVSQNPTDFAGQMPQEALMRMVHDILKSDKVSRVFFDLTSKPPGTTEWE